MREEKPNRLGQQWTIMKIQRIVHDLQTSIVHEMKEFSPNNINQYVELTTKHR